MQVDVKGTTMPLLEMLLDPGESVISTHGELSWMSPNVQLTQTTSTGGQKGTHERSEAGRGRRGALPHQVRGPGGPGMVSFAAKLPGQIFEIAVGPGQGYLVHRHGWVCGTDGVVPTIGMQQSFRGGMYGGDGFVLQRLEGQGQAWIELSGEITTYELAEGQSLLVHPGHVGLFEDVVNFSITRLAGIKNMAFGGDGFHLVSLTGPGRVWLQSMTVPVLAQAIEPYLPRGDDHPAADAGIGGVLGGIIGKNL